MDERNIRQVVSEIKSLWREQIIKEYRNDRVWGLAGDSSNTTRGGVTHHYRIQDRLLYATTRRGKDCLYIPRGHGTNGTTLRELVIQEIHNKGHHSADRNLGYATEYIWWPEIRKDFRDYIRQYELGQLNREWTTLPLGDYYPSGNILYNYTRDICHYGGEHIFEPKFPEYRIPRDIARVHVPSYG